MARHDLAGVPDGGQLVTLENGLVLVRRKKHEPIDFEHVDDLVKLTNKCNGSKFLPVWTLQVYIDWLAMEACNLSREPESHTIAMNRVVGYSNGRKVDKIKIVSDGHYVHAYPVGD